MSERVDGGGGKIPGSDTPPAGGRWNPPADLAYGEKLEVLRDYIARYGLRTMVETGLYNGRGSGMQLRDLFDDYLVIDVDREQVEAAWQLGAIGFVGDSGEVMPLLLPKVSGPAFFWLDAHLVADADEPNSSPLLAELAAIVAWPHAASSVVLVDDVRMMARDGWPTLREVLDVCEPVWACTVEADILRCVPRWHVLQPSTTSIPGR